MTHTERQAIEAREYFDALNRQKWIIAGITVAIAAFTLLFSFTRQSTYEATAKVLVARLPATTASGTAKINVQTESELVSSGPVVAAVDEELGDRAPNDLVTNLSVDDLLGTEVIEITYGADDPEVARAVANAFAENYIEYRHGQISDALTDAETEIEQQLATVEERLDELRSTGQSSEATAEQIDSLIVQRGLLEQRLTDLQPERVENLFEGEVVESATAPSSPSSPNHKRNLIVGVLLGLLVGLTVGFTRDYLQRSPPT